ncbi:zinc finger BED domain-containing protein 5-like [Rhopalosiphum padi]|uniref:zinc finger BED domain-containing protein 5-like n=1 Tax=Rhopalosiphum padi TaxID=40932 RepID=UPI00298E78D9|nr:zinc finger BED domain-containing protein 5-like [Rhopalosiphum padi]
MDRFLLNNRKRASTLEDEEILPSTSRGETVKKRKCRKYDDSYLDFGFTSTEINGEERPLCVLCMKVLAPECMLPSKLKRHLEANHKYTIGKPRDYFIRKLKELKQEKSTFFKNASIPTNALIASYKVSYRIAKCKKPHTIAEELILPAAIDMVNIMVGESAGKLLSKVPLSNNTVSRRIHHMAEDLNDQLIEKIKEKEFGLQLDEATDNNKDAHLICYVRFIDGDDMVEDLLFCKNITASAKAQDLFDILNNFMSENMLDWIKCVGVCTDGARSMSGSYGGLQSLIRSKAPDALWTHCIIHREALAAKYLSPALNQVLECVVNVVNFIKTRPLKARFFKKLCDDMGAEHSSLLYYSNARWLSRGNVLSRTFELRQEIYIFLKEEGHKYANDFSDKNFLIKLAYLCDIFEKLNALNTSLQGNNTHILKSMDKMTAFIKKLKLWRRQMNEGTSKDSFSILQQFLTSNTVEISQDMKSIFEDHLSQLVVWFEKYFKNEDIDKFAWIQDPFNSIVPSEFNSTEEESLIELSCDSSLKSKFTNMELTKFWISIKNEYPLVCEKALRVLIPFSTSYLCEAGFSAVAVIKSKYRSKINVEKEMRVAVSSLIPRFEKICNDVQAHPSH